MTGGVASTTLKYREFTDTNRLFYDYGCQYREPLMRFLKKENGKISVYSRLFVVKVFNHWINE
jgi:hypothetical protein